jgi:anti-sigma factor RsiW
MNGTPARLSDEQLSAWLDDELCSTERAAVDARLLEHAQDATRVRLWAADRDALRARLALAADEPPPMRLEQLVWRHQPTVTRSGWRRYGIVAAFALGAAAGSAAGIWAAQAHNAEARATQWERLAMVAHAVYAPEVRHPVEVAVRGSTPEAAAIQKEHLARWLTHRLGWPSSCSICGRRATNWWEAACCPMRRGRRRSSCMNATVRTAPRA